MSFATRERRLQALVEQHVEQHGAARPRHGVGLSVEFDDGGGRRLVAVVGDGYRCERIGVQRPEHLDVNLLGGHLERLQRVLRRAHERSRPADEGLPAGVGRHQLGERRATRQALQRLQPVHHRQPVRVLRGQVAQRAAEDHRPLVAVGVEQHHPTAALRQRRLANGHHRGDAAARRDQQEVGVEGLGHERARRCQHMDPHALVGVIAQPVRRVAVRGALHGHGQGVVGER